MKMGLKSGQILLVGAVVTLAAGCGFENQKYPGQTGQQTTGVTDAPPASGPSTTSAPPSGTATFTQVNQQILQPKCVGCHGSGNSPDLSSYDAFATNTAYVVPGNPESSALYTAVQSGSMPRGGLALSADEIQLIYNWIKDGAQNN